MGAGISLHCSLTCTLAPRCLSRSQAQPSQPQRAAAPARSSGQRPGRVVGDLRSRGAAAGWVSVLPLLQRVGAGVRAPLLAALPACAACTAREAWIRCAPTAPHRTRGAQAARGASRRPTNARWPSAAAWRACGTLRGSRGTVASTSFRTSLSSAGRSAPRPACECSAGWGARGWDKGGAGQTAGAQRSLAAAGGAAQLALQCWRRVVVPALLPPTARLPACTRPPPPQVPPPEGAPPRADAGREGAQAARGPVRWVCAFGAAAATPWRPGSRADARQHIPCCRPDEHHLFVPQEVEFFSYDCDYQPAACPADKQARYIQEVRPGARAGRGWHTLAAAQQRSSARPPPPAASTCCPPWSPPAPLSQSLNLRRVLRHNLYRAMYEGSTHYAREGPRMAAGLAAALPWLRLVASLREPIRCGEGGLGWVAGRAGGQAGGRAGLRNAAATGVPAPHSPSCHSPSCRPRSRQRSMLGHSASPSSRLAGPLLPCPTILPPTACSRYLSTLGNQLLAPCPDPPAPPTPPTPPRRPQPLPEHAGPQPGQEHVHVPGEVRACRVFFAAGSSWVSCSLEHCSLKCGARRRGWLRVSVTARGRRSGRRRAPPLPAPLAPPAPLPCRRRQPDLFSCLELELPLHNYTEPVRAWLAAFPPRQLMVVQVGRGRVAVGGSAVGGWACAAAGGWGRWVGGWWLGLCS